MRDLLDILAELRAERRQNRDDIKEKPVYAKGGAAWRRQRREEKAKKDKEIEDVYSRAKAQAKYHAANKERLNRARKVRARRPAYVYQRSKKRAEERGQAWEFTFETWWKMWEEAPDVYDKKTGFWRTAWSIKGGNYQEDTQMMRRDTEGPWSVSNCFIGLNGKELEHA